MSSNNNNNNNNNDTDTYEERTTRNAFVIRTIERTRSHAKENKYCFDCKLRLGKLVLLKFGTFLCLGCAEGHEEMVNNALGRRGEKIAKEILYLRRGRNSITDDDDDDDDRGSSTSRNKLDCEQFTDLEVATISVGGNKNLMDFLKNEHEIVVGNLQTKDRARFYRECKELRLYRVELAMAASMRRHALDVEFLRMGNNNNTNDDYDVKDSLGSVFTDIDKEIMEEDERERRERLKHVFVKGEDDEDDDDDDGLNAEQIQQKQQQQTAAMTNIFSNPSNLLKSIDTSGLNKLGTWVQNMTKITSTSTSSQQQQQETNKKMTTKTYSDESLMKEIETIADNATTTTASNSQSPDKDQQQQQQQQQTTNITEAQRKLLLLKKTSDTRHHTHVKARNDAATNVQKQWKAIIERKAFLEKKRAVVTIQSNFRALKARNELKEIKREIKEKEEEEKAAVKIQSRFRGLKARTITIAELREDVKRKENERIELEEKRFRERTESAAILIQKSFKGSRQRKVYGEIKLENAERNLAAARIQSLFRGKKTREGLANEKKAREEQLANEKKAREERLANEEKAKHLIAALEKRERENEIRIQAAAVLQANARGFLARTKARNLREIARYKIEAKQRAKEIVAQKIEHRINELRKLVLV